MAKTSTLSRPRRTGRICGLWEVQSWRHSSGLRNRWGSRFLQTSGRNWPRIPDEWSTLPSPYLSYSKKIPTSHCLYPTVWRQAKQFHQYHRFTPQCCCTSTRKMSTKPHWHIGCSKKQFTRTHVASRQQIACKQHGRREPPIQAIPVMIIIQDYWGLRHINMMHKNRSTMKWHSDSL